MRNRAGQPKVAQRVIRLMTAFATLRGVYNTPVLAPDLGWERQRDQELMSSRALEQFLSSVEKRALTAGVSFPFETTKP